MFYRKKKKKNNRGQTLWGRIALALSTKNQGSCHNLVKYQCAKGRHCTENDSHCIRTPLIHSDLKLKDCFIKKKKCFVPQEVHPNVRLRSLRVRLWTTIIKLVLIYRYRQITYQCKNLFPRMRKNISKKEKKILALHTRLCKAQWE